LKIKKLAGAKKKFGAKIQALGIIGEQIIAAFELPVSNTTKISIFAPRIPKNNP